MQLLVVRNLFEGKVHHRKPCPNKISAIYNTHCKCIPHHPLLILEKLVESTQMHAFMQEASRVCPILAHAESHKTLNTS